jgi:glycosyltransferase involved in cell wall biosynthesis
MNMHFIIITASYNRPELLKRNVEALQAQTYQDWQQIIVDDNSGCRMQDAYDLASTDERIHVIKLGLNHGCNYARNQALEYIRTTGSEGYITLVDDDDYLLPKALETINNNLINRKTKQWVTADCCYPDGTKASRLSRYGEFSYIDNYMYGKEIKGDLNHFVHTSICLDLNFSEDFKNGQEWSYFCQLSARTSFEALNLDVKVIEYLEGGLSKNKVSTQNQIKVFNYKIFILKNLVSPKRLSHQQLLLVRELIDFGNKKGARKLLLSIFRFQFASLRFYRYWIKTFH